MTQAEVLFNKNKVNITESESSSDVAEEVIVRFSNLQLPQRASRNKNNLAAVCCPAFSLS